MMKYPLDNGSVGVIKGDQELGRKCYQYSLRIKREEANIKQNIVKIMDIDPKEEYLERLVLEVVMMTRKPISYF